MGNSYYVWFMQATTDLLTRHSAVFNGMGWNLFKGFAVILIVWYGVTTALGAVSGGVVRWDKFAGLLMSIAFTYAMLSYYNRPLPGIGISFHNLITDEGASLASQIEVATNEDVIEATRNDLRLHGTTERPGAAKRAKSIHRKNPGRW